MLPCSLGSAIKKNLFPCRRPAGCPVNHTGSLGSHGLLALFFPGSLTWFSVNHTGSPGPFVCSQYLFLPLHTCPFAFSHLTFTPPCLPPCSYLLPPVLPSALLTPLSLGILRGAQSAILAHSVPLQMSLLSRGKLTCFSVNHTGSPGSLVCSPLVSLLSLPPGSSPMALSCLFPWFGSLLFLNVLPFLDLPHMYLWTFFLDWWH